MLKKIIGKAWKFGSNIDTDQIIPAEYLVTDDEKELAKHAFEKVRPNFYKTVNPGDIIVAEKNFGCGSSREHAVRALKGLGIGCIIAESFARIFFRNAINLGLLVIEAKVNANDGDILEVDLDNGKIINRTINEEFTFKKPPEFFLNIIESGGLINYVKKKYNI